ncbi:MAG: hypothetical protein QW777_04565 [Candidatus Caldarchaeum sp.]
MRKTLCYVGLYKPSNGRYNHRLRTAVQSLAISYYGKNMVKAREARQLLKKIIQIMAEYTEDLHGCSEVLCLRSVQPVQNTAKNDAAIRKPRQR